ncbi:MAG: single-stranded-DNA-specific exonuclease RecJ [Xenococcaceae cyanobacterium MO_188.B32]|nr:single-stranded-DNA-specific exonuclease RecJ [Xenococcaceae cyanobacterium MO_188.B32]
MDTPQPRWQVVPPPEVPRWFIDIVSEYTPDSDGAYAAQLLWQRGINNLERLPGYLDPDCYSASSPFAFGREMNMAVDRLQQALTRREKVTIWGDFDADGVTSTSVLWDGLGQFFPQHLQLDYYIPNRLTESHGLNKAGIDRAKDSGTKAIVTCDTGSTNIAEIEYARQLDIDIIVTDHHTLPEERPPVTAIINPRYLDVTHPLYSLSGVAVAYKLVEAMYQTLPDVPQQPLENLLDLVAIGLIADLVELKGDSRYLAQKGIQQLQKQINPAKVTRPGIAQLLELCRRHGDRPTDISFGLGPRINAVSRIHGDASFCVELLTSRDPGRCQELALETELANTRRKSLQKETTKQVKQKLERLDLSTTSVIVLEDPQWQGGVLGLVAGQIAQEYGRPTVLLSSQGEIARGSARSVNNIDLYQLVKSQEYLLDRFGGHPFAAGLSLPVENIPLFREGINQQLRQQTDASTMQPTIAADLVVTVAELGKSLFYQLKLLEPCGMGNPVPKLLIQNCWFTNVWNNNIKDARGKKIQYIKTTFDLRDDTVTKGFPGVWWGHYKEELPSQGRCDVIVELDLNTYNKRYEVSYEVRLLAIRTREESLSLDRSQISSSSIIDRRNDRDNLADIADSQLSILQKCPLSWDEINKKYRQAIAHSQTLVLAYPPPTDISPAEVWQQLLGVVKYLARTGKQVTKEQIQAKLNLSDRTFGLGLKAISAIGFTCQQKAQYFQFSWTENVSIEREEDISSFLFALEEEQFQRQYFSQIPLPTLEKILTS